MRAPGFWHRPPGLRSSLLSPLGTVYAAGTARRLRRGSSYNAAVPVICVGNISVGGTGKTPTVIALLGRLSKRKVHVVSRGYGGRVSGPVRVDPAHHSAVDVGDEPLLLSAFAPVWVSRDRRAGVAAAEAAGAEAIIFDDGFQDPAVAKDLSLVVADARRGFGNGHVLPAGPLREPVETGLARADILLTVGTAEDQADFDATWGGHIAIPRARGRLEPLQMGFDWSGLRVMAFAGIGDPAKFFRSLASEGANVVRSVALDDHQVFSDALLARLEREAADLGAQLVTTEKDAARLPTHFRPKVLTFVVRLVLDPGPLDNALARL